VVKKLLVALVLNLDGGVNSTTSCPFKKIALFPIFLQICFKNLPAYKAFLKLIDRKVYLYYIFFVEP